MKFFLVLDFHLVLILSVCDLSISQITMHEIKIMNKGLKVFCVINFARIYGMASFIFIG